MVFPGDESIGRPQPGCVLPVPMPFCRNARSVASAASWSRRRKGDIVMFSISHISTTWKKTKGLVTHHQGTKWEKFHGKKQCQDKKIYKKTTLPISLYQWELPGGGGRTLPSGDVFWGNQPCGLQLLSFEMILLILLSCLTFQSCAAAWWFLDFDIQRQFLLYPWEFSRVFKLFDTTFVGALVDIFGGPMKCSFWCLKHHNCCTLDG